MDGLLEYSVSLQDIAQYYESPWTWVATYIGYCLTVGTVQCRRIAKSFIDREKRSKKHYGSYNREGDNTAIFFAQLAAPIVTVFMLGRFVIDKTSQTIDNTYFKDRKD